MTRGICLVLTTLAATLASGEPWELALNANLTSTQNAYSDNWAGTETGLFSWTAGTDFSAQRQLSRLVNTKNTAKLALGYTMSQSSDSTRKWSKPIKANDLIDLESVLRFTLGGWVDPFASARLESQFLDTRDTALTRYVNPIRLTEGLGIARVIIKQPKRELTSKLGAAFKQTINRSVLEPGATTRSTVFDNYGGLLLTADFNTPLLGERISYTERLSVFQALIYSGAARLTGDSANYWKQPDINWENTFSASITKLLMVNLYVQVLFDREITPGARLKEALALGLTYRLI
ncbi:MAG: DUF3078 domain-containing protein [candidate division WOR-3 bacterium]